MTTWRPSLGQSFGQQWLQKLLVLLLLGLSFWGWGQQGAIAQWGGEQWGTTTLPLEGEPAPDFVLPDAEGQLRHLTDWQGEWVVLYFYPKDFTSGCTIEARRFQQDLAKYQALHAQVVGISADTVERHREFCDSEGLKFTLLADVGGEVSSLYGSWLGDMALRNSFIINPEGRLETIFPIVSPSRHSEDVLAELARLQSAA